MKVDEIINRINVTVDEKDIFGGAYKILERIRPHWSREKIRYKLLTDGITNKLVGCILEGEDEDQTVLVRVYGNKTDLLIDRKAETRNILLLNRVGLAPKLFAAFQNGLAYQFVPGCTLSSKIVCDPNVYRLVAAHMAKMHKVTVTTVKNPVPCLWNKMQNFLNLVPEKLTCQDKQRTFEELNLPNKQELQLEREYLERRLSIHDSPIVFAHNDLLLGNVIYTQSINKVTFIDFEYASFNFQAYDIGNHFAEFAGVDEVNYSYYPNKQLQYDWLRTYLHEYTNKEVAENDIEKLYIEVNQFALAAHLFWAIWCLIQAEHSYIDFDFLKYADQRLGEYFKRKEDFLTLQKHSNKL